jgi:hypothetical protein
MCSEWQPIETAPKDGTPILAYGKYMDITQVPDESDEPWESPMTIVWGSTRSGSWRLYGCSSLELGEGYPTYWMTLPSPPLVDHPRPTPPVVDHEGGESDPQATRISELEAEVESWAAVANREDECRVMWQTRAESAEAEVERLKGELEKEWEWCADDAAIHSKYPIETEYERGYADGRREAAATIRQRARARSTAMNKGGEL